MWNVVSVNSCTGRDKIWEYQRYCERLASAKPKCNVKPPEEFSFLKNRSKKYQIARETQDRINYDMEILLHKMREMNKKPQRYHPLSQKFFPIASSLRFSKTGNKSYELEQDNKYLGNKILNAKSVYSNDKWKESFGKVKYYKKQILKNSGFKNPFLNLVTPLTFEKKLAKYLLTDNYLRENKKTNSDGFNNYNYTYNYNYDVTNTNPNVNFNGGLDVKNYGLTYYGNPRGRSGTQRNKFNGAGPFNNDICYKFNNNNSGKDSKVNSRVHSAVSKNSKKSFAIEASFKEKEQNESNKDKGN